MRNAIRLSFTLILLTITDASFAIGYTHNLFLCDLGIKNANSSNQYGVDFIQYLQNERTMNVFSTTDFSSALNQSLKIDSAFDRWNSMNGIDNISINLESDYFGSQYFLEYCYTWDRIMPTDNMNYEITFLTGLKSVLQNTQLTVDSTCSLMANNGVVSNNVNLNSNVTTTLILTDFKSMRCTIKLNFKEDISFKTRPHNGGDINIDPNVMIKVTP